MATTSPRPPPPTRTPSSSAVTLPRPGKSILKKQRPPPKSFFSLSTISRFLPTQTPSPAPSSTTDASQSSEDQSHPPQSAPLKRAHFILPEMTIVYPISAANPPTGPTIREEKKNVEEREIERRRKLVRGNSFMGDESDNWWSLAQVESFYRECCAGREETPDPKVSAALFHTANITPRAVDLSGVQLTMDGSRALADVLAVEWGLRKLVLRASNLDELILKPILHSLLIVGTLSFLSVASNPRLRPGAFRLLGTYIGKAKTLQYIDVSENSIDKRSVEWLVSALGTAPSPNGLVSLRMDDCHLRPAALEALAHAVRVAPLKNISLRHNRIAGSTAVAIALMIRDYPDTVPASPGLPASSPTISNFPTSPTLSGVPKAASSLLSPQPRTPAQTNGAGTTSLQTTYTPYIPRRRAATAASAPLSPPPTEKQIPLITSSARGGITTRHPPAPTTRDSGPSAALLDKVRALDSLPRLGALRTLDLRGNDIRGGVGIGYVAQVLKRNRTLKVLNLAENKIDVAGLAAIAEALKYNSCLETLDLTKNPCCGPGLEGITALRTAFTLNASLKRLFLSSTGMTSAGAIALAEFLPESMSLLHLDLTNNSMDLAGVLALSTGLKANYTMRCLDLNIPPGDEEFAKLCREILSSCTRNTELAAQQAPAAANVWGLIESSELAKTIKARRSDEEVLEAVKALGAQLSARSSLSRSRAEVVREAKGLLEPLSTIIQRTTDPEKLAELLALNDSLNVADHPSGLHLNILALQNGSAIHKSLSALQSPVPETPRSAEKGKGRADPEPERVELVLSPVSDLVNQFTIDEHDVEEDVEPIVDEPLEVPSIDDDGISPTVERSRSLVEEEGEIFRKGNVLLGPEEMEGEFDGEELRQGLLQAEVERPPQRELPPEQDPLALMEAADVPADELPASPLSPTHSGLVRSRTPSVDSLQAS